MMLLCQSADADTQYSWGSASHRETSGFGAVMSDTSRPVASVSLSTFRIMYLAVVNATSAYRDCKAQLACVNKPILYRHYLQKDK